MLDPEKDESRVMVLRFTTRRLDQQGKGCTKNQGGNEEEAENLTVLELYDKNLVKAINTRFIPVAAYAMNICQISQKDLYDLDMLVQDTLRRKRATRDST